MVCSDVGEKRLYRDLDIPFLNDLGSIEDLDLKRLPSRGEMDNDSLGNISGVNWLPFSKLNG